MVSTEIKVVESNRARPRRRGTKGRKGGKNKKKKEARRKLAMGGELHQEVGVAQSTVRRTYEPEISQTGGPKGSMRIKHREFLTDVVSGSSANTYQILFNSKINPGDRGCFPWLSRIARKYEKYIPHGLRLFFASEQSSTQPGSVMMVVEYESTDAAPQSKQDLLNCKGAVRSAPWQNCDFISDPKDLKQRSQYFVNSGSMTLNGTPALVPGGAAEIEDPRLDDIGVFFMACQNVVANLPLGELWIEYDIEFITPQQGNEPNGCTIVADSGAPSSSPNMTANAPWGTRPTMYGKLDVDYNTASGVGLSTVTFRDTGRYFLALDIDAVTLTNLQINYVAPVTGGLAPTPVTSALGSTLQFTTTAGAYTGYVVFDVPEGGGRVTIAASTFATAAVCEMSILSIPSGYIPY